MDEGFCTCPKVGLMTKETVLEAYALRRMFTLGNAFRLADW